MRRRRDLGDDSTPRGGGRGCSGRSSGSPESGSGRESVVIAAPATPWLQFERCVLGEDRLLESLQRLTRLDPQLVHEHAPCSLVRVQGLRLSAGPVKGEHQQSAKPLAQRVVSDKGFEL